MGSCIGCCCCSICCCQCNFAIFPAPSPSYNKNQPNHLVHYFQSQSGHQIPYLEIKVENAKTNVIYFHGNAEDIIYSTTFLLPISEELEANIYAIEYPSYGTYQMAIPALISNRIKSNSLEFYDYLIKNKSPVVNSTNTIILGRSIGSGGACYLAAHKNIRNLALISPFSTIPNVAADFAGCFGKYLVKEHFNNLEEISNYDGRLLIIHGKMDEVIAFRHGEQVLEAYKEHKIGKQENPREKLRFVTPSNMTHNYFDFEKDILDPLKEFSMGMKEEVDFFRRRIP